jgi:peptide/nickel transport system permease protein
MSMAKFIARRSGEIVISLFLVATLTFALFRLMPSDPVGLMLSPTMTPEMKQKQREIWGLDKSLQEQYLIFIKNMVKGEFGTSFFSGQDVFDILKDRLPATLLLFTTMAFLSFSLGMHAGRIIAWRRGGNLEFSSTILAMLLYSMPIFWICLMILWIFSFELGLFPLGGMKSPQIWDVTANSSLFIKIVDVGHHLFLPLTSGTLLSAPGIVLLMRSVMIETMEEDYITTARAKGLSETMIRDHHASRNVMLPLATVLTLAIVSSFSGNIIIETIFSWPGVGYEFMIAIGNYDYPVVQGAFILTGALLLIAIFLADILYAYIDPRIRIG